jgi:hypothetical protein
MILRQTLHWQAPAPHAVPQLHRGNGGQEHLDQPYAFGRGPYASTQPP